jgi:hypothetical protein
MFVYLDKSFRFRNVLSDVTASVGFRHNSPVNIWDQKEMGGGGPGPKTQTPCDPLYLPQTGHDDAPVLEYNIEARLSCSASDAAAGSPDPPTLCHVLWLNWYLPLY